MGVEDTDDDLEREVCESCGAEVADEDTTYGLPEGRWLCMDCAIARGGAYHADEDRWGKAPRVDDLL